MLVVAGYVDDDVPELVVSARSTPFAADPEDWVETAERKLNSKVPRKRAYQANVVPLPIVEFANVQNGLQNAVSLSFLLLTVARIPSNSRLFAGGHGTSS